MPQTALALPVLVHTCFPFPVLCLPVVSQGHICHLPLRSVEETVNVSEEENSGPQQAEDGSQQVS